uniref:Uncharacterized protein n=1 Tax=Timema bartmani TaxID=61472 RepID=A0A7R9I416_9NEOP|nr:unnamed protein product [Timema bartmani]
MPVGPLVYYMDARSSRRTWISWVLLSWPPFLQHHLEGKLQRGRVAVVDVADHSVSLVFDLVHDTRDVHCSAPVNNTRSASFGGTFQPVSELLL